jgi:hypothetical protein
MIMDGLLQFSGTAGIAGSPDTPTTGTQVSGNVIDMGRAMDIGVGSHPEMRILAVVTTAFTAGTSIQVNAQGSVDNTTFTTMVSGPVIIEANLTIGTRLLDVDWPRIVGATADRPGASQAMPRYLRLQYVTVGTHSAGGIFATILLDRTDWLAYPPGLIVNN